MKNSRNSRFERGSGVYNCSICGRCTRHTGVQSTGSDLCPQCYELAGLQNMVWDGDALESVAHDRDAFLSEAIKRGGSELKIRREFRELFPDPAA